MTPNPAFKKIGYPNQPIKTYACNNVFNLKTNAMLGSVSPPEHYRTEAALHFIM